MVRYFHLTFGLALNMNRLVNSSLWLSHDDSFGGEASLVDKLVLTLDEVFGNDYLLWFLFFINGSLLLALLNLIELCMLRGPLSLYLVYYLLILLIQIEIVNYVSDVGHWLCFGRLRLKGSQKLGCL